MKKRILFAILGVLVIVAILAGIKTLQIRTMIDNGKKFVPPPETVSTAKVTAESWESAIVSVGTLTALQGVNLTAETSGKVMKITFESGSAVKKGDLLIQQDAGSEEAQLPGAQAQVTLTDNDLKRSVKMFAEGIISQADQDKAQAAYRQAKSQVDNLQSAINKKNIRAPFSGRIGIRQVNLGQMLREGDPIVTLQALDPIYVDFSIPQQELSKVSKGLAVKITGDVLGSEAMTGRITAISPMVDADTRSIKIQATVANRGERLRPGMFVNASIGLPARRNILVIPATAALYAPYSDSVFVVEQAKDGKGMLLRQQFVRLDEKRGDMVAVSSGLKPGETVVSTGVFKLRNGQAVVVDNKLSPQFQQSPKPENN